jgi:hypothetical protein
MFLIRQARRSIWTGEEVVQESRRIDARATFARRPVDTDGVSMFAIDHDEQVELVVAAYACSKMDCDKIDLLRIEDDEIVAFGEVCRVGGTTPVPAANALHRVLDWTDEALARLVDLLLEKRRKSTRYPANRVRAAVLRLGPNGVDDGPHRAWVQVLTDRDRSRASS